LAGRRWDGADFESGAHAEADDQRSDRSVWVVEYGTQRYVESLKMMYELLQKARKEGLVALESDIEEPEKSPLLTSTRIS